MDSVESAIARLDERVDNFEGEMTRRLRRIEEKVDTTNGRVTSLESQAIRRAAIEEVQKAIRASRVDGIALRFAFVAAAGTIGGVVVAILALLFQQTGW